MKQQVTVKVIIKKDAKILLVKPKGGLYILPGEPLPVNQTSPKATAQQAIRSSIGRSAETIQLSDIVSYVDPAQPDVQQVVVVFLASLGQPNAKILLNELYAQYDWLSLSEIHPKSVDLATRNVLQIAAAVEEYRLGATNIDEKITTPHPHEVLVYTDGGSRGNPGPSAAGFVVYGPNEELLFEGGKYLGITTNNQAEYQAVKLGLEKAIELGARVVRFRMDSQLIVNQMLGIYQVKNRDLWPIYAHIKELTKRLDGVTFQHVRREFNKEADGLVNKVLDERGH